MLYINCAYSINHMKAIMLHLLECLFLNSSWFDILPQSQWGDTLESDFMGLAFVLKVSSVIERPLRGETILFVEIMGSFCCSVPWMFSRHFREND